MVANVVCGCADASVRVRVRVRVCACVYACVRMCSLSREGGLRRLHPLGSEGVLYWRRCGESASDGQRRCCRAGWRAGCRWRAVSVAAKWWALLCSNRVAGDSRPDVGLQVERTLAAPSLISLSPATLFITRLGIVIGLGYSTRTRLHSSCLFRLSFAMCTTSSWCYSVHISVY